MAATVAPIPRPYRASVSPERRLQITAAILLAHIATFAMVLASPRARVALQVAGEGVPRDVAFVSLEPSAPPSSPVSAPSAPPRAAAPASPVGQPPDPSASEPIAHPEDLGLPAPRADLEPDPLTEPAHAHAPAAPAALAAPADPCGLGAALQTALQGDGRVRAALALIPRQARSVANAIMLWDGHWVPVGSAAGDAGLEPIRSAIVEALRAAPPNCQAASNTGPLLLSIADPTGETVLAVGSGTWKATDLISQESGTEQSETRRVD